MARTNAPIRIRLFLVLRVVIQKHILVSLVLPLGSLLPFDNTYSNSGSLRFTPVCSLKRINKSKKF